ncbi:hypothetical protein K504DRAFT_31842 [Pleomassaria siparia CBS 279.74]|uniref:Uncharacterized protein n=1 Tax=Pleomassaria siparia CBS 279.74 TaxID=1314801 RepID=A0A6G1KS60_9PLEO|nr:hypothetical protein K504DRAFT_31842 [Pleomassaria siparia CBS 279.74]
MNGVWQLIMSKDKDTYLSLSLAAGWLGGWVGGMGEGGGGGGGVAGVATSRNGIWTNNTAADAVDTAIQRYSDTTIQRYSDTAIQRYSDAAIGHLETEGERGLSLVSSG